MLYSYIKDIDPTDRFMYTVITVFIIILTVRLGHNGMINGTGVFGLVISLMVIYYLNDKRRKQGTDYITAMDEILGSKIMKPGTNLYLAENSELLIFMNSYREYYQYNPTNWNTMVRQVNNFLRLIHELNIGTYRFNLDYDNLKAIKKKILNTYQAFIHTVPHTEASTDKFQKGMSRLQDLLNKEIDLVHQLVNKRNREQGVDTSSVFHYKNHPAAFEQNTLADSNYSFFP